MFCRRGKYMDFFICSSFIILFVYAYFSRQVLLEKLREEEDERLKLEHNANSLKEELKIVYYHTSKLEEALKAEQDSHKSTNSRLSSQSLDFKVNMTTLQRQYAAKLKEKNDNIKTYMLENEELKEKHKLVEKHFNLLAKEHKKVANQVKTDYDALKKSKEEESIRLQDEIQETYNRKVYFQKKAALNEDDYKKTLKKLARCKSILSRRNITTHSQMQKILTSNSAHQKRTAKAPSKKKVKAIAYTAPTQSSINLEAKAFIVETTSQLSERLEELPTEKVVKRYIPNNSPTEKALNKVLKELPTERANTHPALALDIKHEQLELPTENIVVLNLPHKEVINKHLVENPAPKNVFNELNIDHVESPVNLNIIETRKPFVEERPPESNVDNNVDEIAPMGDVHDEAAARKPVVKKIASKIAAPRLQIEDNT